MKKILLSILFIFSLVSCNQSKIKIDGIDESIKKPAKTTPTVLVSVSNVDIISNQLVISGSNLETATSVRVTGPSGFDESFVIESQSSTSLVANGLNNILMAVNGVFSLIISNAEGASTYTITFDLQDGQVTAAKLSGMGAVAGEVLTYDGTNWGPAPLTGLSYKGTFDATAGDQRTVAEAAGHYYIVNTSGTNDPDGTSNGNTYSTGDWAVYNGTTATWDVVIGSNNVVSVAGKTGVVTLTWGDITKTGSLLSDIANVNVTGRVDGDILVWDNTGSEWIVQAQPTDTNTNAGTLCNAGEYLDGDGTCKTVPVDTNTNAGTLCSAGEYLDGDGTCKTAAATDTNAGTLCNAGEYLDGDGTCKAIPVDTDTDTTAGTLCSAGEYLDGDGTCKTMPTPTTSLSIGNITNAASEYFIYQPNNSACGDGEVLKWDNANSRWDCGTDTGTTYSAGAGLGLTGTTFNVDAGTGNNQIVQLDGTARLPAVDGSQLTNVTATSAGAVNVDDVANGAGLYFDYRPNNIACAEDQILQYDATNFRWECGAKTVDTNTTYTAGAGIDGTAIASNEVAINLATNTALSFQVGQLSSAWSLVGTDMSYTGGNVGIGTTTPARALEVRPSSNVPAARFAYPSGSGGIELYGNSLSTDYINFGDSAGNTNNGFIEFKNTSNATDPGTLSFGTSQTRRLSIDPSGNIGVGTTTPSGYETGTGSKYFDIQGTNGSSEMVIRHTGTSIGHAAALSFASDSNRIAYIRTQKSGTGLHDADLVFGTSDGTTLSEKMRIEKDGSVGIGITNPRSILHVRQANARPNFTNASNAMNALTQDIPGLELLIDGNQNTGTQRYGMGIKFMAGDNALSTESEKFVAGIFPAATETYDTDDDGGTALEFFVTENTPGINNVPNLSMIINQDGNVGIGNITLPNEKLTVLGNIALREGSAPTLTNTYGKLFVKSADSKLYFLDDSGNEYNLLNGTGSGNTALGNNWISNDGDAEGIYILADGKVGVGMNNPSQDLEVTGTIKATAGSVWSSNSSTGTSRSFILDNVDDSANQNGVDMAAKLGGTEFQGLSWTQDTAWTSGSVAADKDVSLSFGVLKDNVAANPMTLTSEGFLGIGTAVPAGLIHAFSSGGGSVIIAEHDDTGGDAAVYSEFQTRAAGTKKWAFGSIGDTHTLASNKNKFYIYQYTDQSDTSVNKSRLVIEDNGNIGLGEENQPDWNLHLTSTGNVISTVESSDNGPTQLRFISDDTSNRRVVALDSSGTVDSQINLGDNGAITFAGPTISSDTHMSILSSGNVGIGTRNPSDLLEVEKTVVGGKTAIRVENPDTSAGSMAELNATSGTSYLVNQIYGGGFAYSISNAASGYTVGTYAASPLIMSTNSSERMRIDSAGNVGIGTTAPEVELDVNIGVINASAICDESNSNCIDLSAGVTANPIGVNDLTDGKSLSLSYFIGAGAGLSEVSNTNSTGFGFRALRDNTSGSYNVAFGVDALRSNTAGSNTALGGLALRNNTTGGFNVAVGRSALDLNTTGGVNTAVGTYSLTGAASSSNNTSVGGSAMRHVTAGSHNVALGSNAGRGVISVTSGNQNVFVGASSGQNVELADGNTFIGYNTGGSIVNGDNNIAVGHNVDFTSDVSSQLNIGNTIYGDLSSGNVGIGTNSPAYDLHVFGSGISTNALFESDTAASAISFKDSGTVTQPQIVSSGDGLYLQTSGSERLRVTPTGNVGIGTGSPDQKLSVNGDASKTGGIAWAVFSDARLKTVTGKFERGLAAVRELDPVFFRYNEDNPLGIDYTKEQVGFVAQEVEKVVPEAVTMMDSGYLQLQSDAILWTMLNSIKELDLLFGDQVNENVAILERFKGIETKVNENSREIASLKEENNTLKEKVENLEERLKLLEEAILKK